MAGLRNCLSQLRIVAVKALIDDKQGIPDDLILYRRVDWDRIGGRPKCPPGEVARLSGNAFTDYKEDVARELGYEGPCMSVALGRVLEAFGFPSSKVIEEYEGYGLARVRVGDLRQLTRFDGSPCPQGVMASPTEKEPWHCVVFDYEAGQRKRAVCSAIVRVA